MLIRGRRIFKTTIQQITSNGSEVPMERSKNYNIMFCPCKISLTAYSLRKSSFNGKKSQNSIFPNGNTNIIPLTHSFMIKQKSPYDGKFSLPHYHEKYEFLRKFNQPNTGNRNHKVLGQNIN